MTELACDESDVDVDDIGVAGSATDHADGSGVEVIQWAHLDHGITEKSGDARLAGTPSPTLRNNAGRNHAIDVVFDDPSQQGTHTSVSAFECKQCPSVEGETGRCAIGFHVSPSALSAHASVAGSTSPNSRSRSSRSSVRLASRSARAMAELT